MGFIFVILLQLIECSDFLRGTNRAKLFEITDFNIPKIYINVSESDWKLLIQPKTNEKNEFIKVDSMNFVLNDTIKSSFSSVKINISGHTKNYKKLEYTIKILDSDKDLFGRRSIQLRSDMRDASMMRTKLTSDLLNHLGIPSLSANYCHLYINGEFMGLYILQDIYKQYWIKNYYKNINLKKVILYQCNKEQSDLTENNLRTCVNLSDSPSYQPLANFINLIKNISSRSQVESIMDVDEFIKTWIVEWLIGSWDHMLQSGKNYYLYQQNNGKWQILLYDFDSTFGQFLPSKEEILLENNNETQGLDNDTLILKSTEFNDLSNKIKRNNLLQNIGPYMNASSCFIDFPYWYVDRPVVDGLIASDYKSFLKNLYEIIQNGFNPKILFPRIDELKEWLDPYIKEDRTIVNDILPGRINNNGTSYDSTYEEFKLNTEYTTVNYGVGIKKWIQDRFDFVCEQYKLNCNGSTNSTIDFYDLINNYNNTNESNNFRNEHFNKYFGNLNKNQTCFIASESSAIKNYLVTFKYIIVIIGLIISLIY